MPRVRALERQLNPGCVKNTKSGVVHKVRTWGIHDVPPHAWTTCCGWRYGFTQYEVHSADAGAGTRCVICIPMDDIALTDDTDDDEA
eukprot:6299883-Amphidinium_carterae.1